MTPTDVSVLTESLPGSRVGLTIEVPLHQVDAAYERVLARLGRRVKVQGFRPGKAPSALVEARVGSDVLREEVAEALVPKLVSDALRDRSIEAIDRPQVEIQELERGRPGRFVARVSVMPEVKLPDLDSLVIERQHTVVDDEMLEARMEALRERLAEVEPVEREIRQGDVAVADLRVFVDDKELPEEARAAIELEVKERVLIPELLAALPGTRAGEVAVAEAKMADDHSNPDVRGKTARLEVTVHGVKEKRLPDLTDEVASQLSDAKQDTVAALREAQRAELEEEARRSDQLDLEQKSVQALVDAAEVDVPDPLVDREVDREVDDLQRRLQRQGMRLERYLQYLGRTEPAYRADLRQEAATRVRIDLVLEELGKTLGIEPSDEEVRAHMRQEAEQDAELKESLDQFLQNQIALDYFHRRLSRLRILEELTRRLGGGDVPAAPPAATGDASPTRTEDALAAAPEATREEEGA